MPDSTSQPPSQAASSEAGESEKKTSLKTKLGRFQPPLLVLLAALAAALVLLIGYLLDAQPASSFTEAVQERVDAGKLPTEKQVRGIGLHRAAVANTALLLALLATCWWWSAPLHCTRFSWPKISSDNLPTENRQRRKSNRLFLAALLSILVLSGILRWNLVSGSMWWDEAWAMQNVYLGEFEEDPLPSTEPESTATEKAAANGLEFVGYESNWQRSLWRYWSPLNHPVASITSQAAHAAWPHSEEFAPHEFEEWVLRLPALIAGLLATVLIALSIRRWGFPAAGLIAALLLALHPWAIRHTSEIRSYPFVLLAAAAGVYFITRILQSRKGSWAPWLGFGLAQILLVWSHIFAATLALSFSIVLLVAIFFAWPEKFDRLRAIGRLAVINLLAAGVFFQLFGPNIVQALSWAEEFSVGDGNHLTSNSITHLLTLVITGMPWDLGGSAEAVHLASLKTLISGHPLLSALTGLVTLGAIGAGGFLLWKKFRPAAWLLIALLAGAAGTIAAIGFGGLYFYPRFLIYLLIPFVALFAIGASAPFSHQKWLPVRLAESPLLRFRFVIPLTAVALFTLAVLPQIKVLNRTSIEPLREVAEELHLYRLDLSKETDSVFQAAGIGHGSDKVRLYFPEAAVVRDLGVLTKLIAEADASESHLLIYVGHRYFNETVHADLIAAIDDDSRFEQVSEHRGIKPDFFYRIYRYRNPLAPAHG